MTEASLLQDGIRSVLWLFCQFALWLMDLCYGIINDLSTLNLGDFSFIWSWFRAVGALLYFFITIRMVVYFIKATLDEDAMQKIDPLNFVQRIAYISIIMVMIPSLTTGFSELSANAVNSIGTLTGTNVADAKPSQIVAAAGYNGNIEDFDYENIDINEKADGYYVQFSNNSDIVFLTFSSIVACLVFVFIGIQIAQRVIGLLLKIVIAPFALSGMINPEDNTFEVWRKLIEADFLTNFFQMVLVLVVMVSSTLVPVGAIAKCIFFIGALMAVMNAPAGVAQLLGGDVGVGTAFQQMQSLMMLSQGAQMAGQAVQTAGSAGMYLGGRALGGKSLLSGGMSGGGSGSTGGSASTGGSGGSSGGGAVPSGSSGGSGTPPVMPVGGSAGSADAGRVTRAKWSNPVTQTEHATPARWAADQLSGSNIGQMVNSGMSALYQRSAANISRPRMVRDPGGGMRQRRSAFMTGRSLVYGKRDIVHAASQDLRSRPQKRSIEAG